MSNSKMSDPMTASSTQGDHAFVLDYSIDSPPPTMTAERWTNHLQSIHRHGIKCHWNIPIRIRTRGSRNDDGGGGDDNDNNENDLERRLHYRNAQYHQTNARLKNLASDDYQLFSWKDCAIYVNHGPYDWEVSHTARETVYSEWFPHRARDLDFNHESYFAKPMRFDPPARNLQEIVKFHRTLCAKLLSLEPDVPEKGLYWPVDAVIPEKEDRGSARGRQYQLRPTFLQVFIVVEDGWEANGVLLVCMDEGTAESLVGTAAETDDMVQRHEITDGSKDVVGLRVFRCPLKRAMKLVVSRDPERAKRRKEYCAITDETYGSEDEDGGS